MFRSSLSAYAICFLLFSISLYGQTGNACDLNQDGVVDSTDVQAAINMALGLAPCSAAIAGVNVCNVIVVQRIINAATGGTCLTTTGLHSVALNWTASTSSNIAGYNIYRGTTSGGPYTLLSAVGNVTSFTDTTVVSGQTYYYVATALDSSGDESAYSAEASAVIPIP